MRDRAPWEALHRSLRVSLQSYQATRAYRSAAVHEPCLAPFSDGEALVAALAQRGGDPDHKQVLLVALVHLAQGAYERLGATLLWLGLWPGLDAVYRRSLRFATSAQEVVSDVSLAFTGVIRRIDPARGQRLAATLVRNTERELSEWRSKEWKYASWERAASTVFSRGSESSDGQEAWLHEVESRALQTWEERAGGLLEAVAPLAAMGREREWFLQWLREVAGQDAPLLAAVVVWEQTQHEAGRRQELSHEAARKRFRRALARVRARLVERMSQFEGERRVSVGEEGTHGST